MEEADIVIELINLSRINTYIMRDHKGLFWSSVTPRLIEEDDALQGWLDDLANQNHDDPCDAMPGKRGGFASAAGKMELQQARYLWDGVNLPELLNDCCTLAKAVSNAFRTV